MEKYFFILGRNQVLSRIEIVSFLEARKIKFEELFFEDNYLVLNLEKDFGFNIEEFGGVLKFGKILFSGKNKEFIDYLSKGEIVPSDKFTFSVSGNLDLAEFLKDKFKGEKKKAMLKHGKGQIKFQDGEKIGFVNSEFNFFLKDFKGIIYFGLSTENYDSSEVERRDMGKPVRREALAISPRLSKILINLSGVKKGDLLLDPFCGVGGVLIEAILKGIRVYGVDKDGGAISSARKNFEWVEKEYSPRIKYFLKNMDSGKISGVDFDGVATETPLGILLKKRVNDLEAKKIINKFESFIVIILSRLSQVKKKNARIAITFPVVGRNHVDVGKVCEKSGLEIVYGPIEEKRPDQFISRDILVFK